MSLLDQRASSIKAFVFDFYGTLVQDLPFPTVSRRMKELGYWSHPDLEAAFEPNAFDGVLTPRLDEPRGHTAWLEDNWRGFISLCGVPEHQIDRVLGEILALKASYRPTAVPCAADLIDELRARGYRVGLCSNWEEPITAMLQAARLPWFDAVVTSAEAGARKPHPAIFTTVCDALGLPPDQVAFVGDSWSADVVGALRAGMAPVWIRGARPSHHMRRLVAEFPTLDDLALHLLPNHR